MNVTHEDQLLLLDLQRFDQRESRLRHVRNSHPAHAKLKELSGRAEDLSRAAITQGAVISDIRREVSRIEGDIEKVAARRTLQRGRLDRGEVPMRDMSSMEHEIARMDQRLADLEETQLEAMERLEAAEKAQIAMKSEGAAIAADVEATKASFMEEMADTDAELRQVIASRAELAERLSAPLMSEYDRSRSKNGTLAVVEVRGDVVVGAASDISPNELDAIRKTPTDQLYWTEETGQIVVRTNPN